MTTETERIRETIEAVLETATDAPTDAKRGPKRIFEFRQRPEDTHTVKVTWWPPRKGKADPPALSLGTRYRVTLEKKSTGEEGKFYRDFIEATPVAASDAPPAAPRATPTGAPLAPEPPAPRYDARNTSIERQVALKAAVEVVLASEGEETPTTREDHILAVAQRFAAFLAAAPQEQGPAAPEQGALPAAVAFEDLGRPGEPTSQQWSVFWTWCKAQNPRWYLDAVTKKLGMTPALWLAAQPGRTLADIRKVLEGKGG